MLRTPSALIVALLPVLVATGCPDPEEVGHAPKAQVDEVKARVEKAEDKIEANTAAAAAVHD
jgi:hypothetical protein